MRSVIRPAIVSFLALSLITGVIYPLVVTAIAQVAFARQAGGSVVERDGKAVGLELIGQPFTDPKYFWSRPSATSPAPYTGDAGAGSNFSQANPALADAVKQRVEALRAADPSNAALIPIDLATASGSGLDPHISLAAAEYQSPRVAHERHLSEADLRAIVRRCTEGSPLGLLGEPRVNVLRLNIMLDATPSK